MKQYLELLQNILDNGEVKENRTAANTLAIPPMSITHDMADGFPLLTTKKMSKKSMAVELQGFINGVCDKRWYAERGCKIWNEWCRPDLLQEELLRPENLAVKLEVQKCLDDLGPIYGERWARFGQSYAGIDSHAVIAENRSQFDEEFAEGLIDLSQLLEDGDQFHHMLYKLKSNPNDRRMVVSAWDPCVQHMQALPPCHWSFVVNHINGKLHLAWQQRSVDSALGLPFNLSSYALLLLLLCKETGLEPGTVTGHLVDVHLYDTPKDAPPPKEGTFINQIEAAKEQLTREPMELCHVDFKKWDGIYNWDANDLIYQFYESHPAIKVAVVV